MSESCFIPDKVVKTMLRCRDGVKGRPLGHEPSPEKHETGRLFSVFRTSNFGCNFLFIESGAMRFDFHGNVISRELKTRLSLLLSNHAIPAIE